jgi:hypothetical protein
MILYTGFLKILFPVVAGLSFFCVPSRMVIILEQFLKEDIFKALRANRISTDKIHAAGLSFTPSNNMLFNTLSIGFMEEVRLNPHRNGKLSRYKLQLLNLSFLQITTQVPGRYSSRI